MNIQIMLGPQTPQSHLGEVIRALGVDGPIVTITAGWRDSEGEIDELQAEIESPLEDLGIYHRAEEIFAREPQLHVLHRERQDQLLELQRLYRLRLHPTLAAARTLLRTSGQPALLRLEQRAAISQVRALDRHHVRRIDAIHREFDQRRAALQLPVATTHRDDVQQRVATAGLVLIAGGHVAVLLNRIRLFRLGELLAQRPLIAWSAGAMVLAERIVLFHDDAPQGRRDAEVLDAGLGIVQGLIPLPHAKSRLDWSSRSRMALFSRRFAPALSCTLDNGSMIRLENGRIVSTQKSCVMTRSGRKKELTLR
jgi:peptidase E